MLSDKLRARGMNLARPASDIELDELKMLVSCDVFNALYNHIYQWFNGFENDDFDEESFLRVWPIKRIIASSYFSSKFVPFLDFSLDSEIYGLVSGRVPEILCFRSKKPASVGINYLIAGITTGKFDNALGI